jgi:hypothetical protein
MMTCTFIASPKKKDSPSISAPSLRRRLFRDRKILLLAIGMAAASCATPMVPSEIDELTTCHNTSLADIRASMLRNGYTIKEQTARDIQSEYRDLNGDFQAKLAEQVNVTAKSERDFQFTVRLRHTRYGYQNSVSIGSSMQSSPRTESGGMFTYGFGERCERTFDENLSYYQENRDAYIDRKQRICGSSK